MFWQFTIYYYFFTIRYFVFLSWQESAEGGSQRVTRGRAANISGQHTASEAHPNKAALVLPVHAAMNHSKATALHLRCASQLVSLEKRKNGRNKRNKQKEEEKKKTTTKATSQLDLFFTVCFKTPQAPSLPKMQREAQS